MSIELTKGNEYLIRKTKHGFYDPIMKVRVLDVTEKCFQLKYENGNIEWILKEAFEEIYPLVRAEFEIIEMIK